MSTRIHGVGYKELKTMKFNPITLECPNCEEEVSSRYRYDEEIEEQVTCKACDWTSAKCTFEYLRGEDNE